MKLPFLLKHIVHAAVALGFFAAPAPEALAGKPLAGEASDGIVFVVPSKTGFDLWRARLEDGALQRLSETPKIEERWPAWSDAARRLAYVARNSDGMMKSTIMLLDVESGKESALGPEPDFIQRSVSWSPDGKSIAHAFRIPPSGQDKVTDAGAAIFDLEKQTREIVAEVEEIGYRILNVSYAHDGKSLVAHGRNPANSVDDKLWLLRAGQKPRALGKIPRGIYARPRFTRDDKKVVFNYQQTRTRNRDLMILELGPGKRAQRVSSNARNDDHSAALSGTRDEMVFVSDRLGSPNLLLVDLTTGKPKILTQDLESAATNPVWSPDGNRIAYVSMPKDQFRSTEKLPEQHRVRVIDRTGKLLFETEGTMPSFMTAWSGEQPVAAHTQTPTNP